MRKENILLIELVKAGVWKNDSISFSMFYGCDWEVVLKCAKLHAVIGVAFAGLKVLLNSSLQNTEMFDNCYVSSFNINEKLYLKWLGLTAKIAQQFKDHVIVKDKVHKMLLIEGIDHVFMKGLVCGERYAEPSSRACGDIDFLVRKKDFEHTLDALEKIGEVDRTLVHEHHGMAYVDGVQLEPHYKLHNFQNRRNDRTLMMLTDEWLFRDDRMPLEFEGMFLIAHMVNHVYEEGLGLRQVVDFAAFLRTASETKNFDWDCMYGLLKKMRMWKAYRLFALISNKYLDVKIDGLMNICTKRDIRDAEKLMEDVMEMGNFGRGAYVFDHSSRWGEFQNYLWVTKRAWKMRFVCPSEAMCWPMSKFIRWFRKQGTEGGKMMGSECRLRRI